MRERDPQHVSQRRAPARLPAWANIGLLILFLVIVGALSYFTFNRVKKLVAGAPLGSGDPFFSPGSSATAETASTQAAPGEESVVYQPGGRVNVLLLGIDERQSETGPWRTDTMILLTINPSIGTAGILSIPRDLWVEIPGYTSFDRINNAFFRGDADRYPGGGGSALAMATVQQNFGIPVDYFVTVNFEAFVTIIDEIGCVPINVPQTIDDPDYPAAVGSGYEPFYLEAGNHCLDGETLLKYARTRATFGGDFDRAERQQQVLFAIREHVLSTDQVPTIIARIPEIYGALQQNVNTNLSEGQIIELALAASDIQEEMICSAVVSGDYIERLETLHDGSQVVIPDREDIRQLMLDLYNGTGVCDPDAHDWAAEARAENAAISVVNGTTREGLAISTADRIAAAGLRVAHLGNADRFDYAQTVIVDYTGKTATAYYLAELLRVPSSAVVTSGSSPGAWDVQVILGRDYQAP